MFKGDLKMNSPSVIVVLGLIAWTLLLLIVMELLRTRLILAGEVPANALLPDNANLSPFMQRLARAHANCYESVPFFIGLLLVAVMTGHADVTDALAPWLLGARIVQSSVHMASLSLVAVNVRFLAFALQVGIAVYWCIALFAA